MLPTAHRERGICMLQTHNNFPDESWIEKYRAALDQVPPRHSPTTEAFEVLSHKYVLFVEHVVKVFHRALGASAYLFRISKSGGLPTPGNDSQSEEHSDDPGGRAAA